MQMCLRVQVLARQRQQQIHVSQCCYKYRWFWNTNPFFFLIAVRQLLSNVINLETNIYNLQKERLQLERERFEMERDYGKEMLNVFKEIKDKLCDMIPVPMASAATSTSNVISKGSELEHNKKE